MYKLQKNINMDGSIGQPVAVIRLSDNAVIPFDPDNTDFVAYQKWLSESPDNIPQEAE